MQFWFLECEDEIIQSPPPSAEQTYTENYYPTTAPPTSHTPEQTTHSLTNGIDRLNEPPSASTVDALATPVSEPELSVQPSPEPSPVPEEPQEVSN